MSTDLVKRGETAVASVNETDIIKYLDMIGSTTQLTENEKQLFIMKCVAEGLNPHKGDIYPIAYTSQSGRTVNMITAYQVFIRRAEQTGKLKHWRVWTEGSRDTNDLVAYIEIERSDWDHPFIFDVDYAEFCNKTSTWNKMPKHMLKKCAIGNGFRLAFPEDCGGLYLEEEMNTHIETVKVTMEPEPTENKKRSRTDRMTEQIRRETPVVPEDADPFEEVCDTLIGQVLNAIDAYTTEAEYNEAVALAKQLTDEDEISQAREAFKKRAHQEG